MKAIRVIQSPVLEKASDLRFAVGAGHVSGVTFDVELSDLRQVPGSPLCYWAAKDVLSAYASNPSLEQAGYQAAFGASTKNDFRYLRLTHETQPVGVSDSRRKTGVKPWVRLAKGGHFSRFYADLHLLVWWGSDGLMLKTDIAEYRGKRGWGYQWSAALNGHSLYFRPGLTWPRRTNGLSFRVMPTGCIFADKGPAAFVEGDDAQRLLALCAVVNSASFGALVRVQLARTELAQSYEVGLIQQTPVPTLSPADADALAQLARRAWSLKRSLDTSNETSHAFALPALLHVATTTLSESAIAWSTRVTSTDAALDAIQHEIDDRCAALYGISPEDQRPVSSSASPDADAPDADASEEDEAEDDLAPEADPSRLTASLLSWSLGVAFGRFDVRLATGARALPVEPDPFDPLPVCSPGMLTGDDGLPLAAPPPGYPLDFPFDGVLVDDPGHPRHLVAAVRAVLDEVFDDGDTRWHEAAELVGARGGDLRGWFARTFFAEHIQRYSKSRRKAPIYWQLATPSGSYSVWIYIHRATSDTLFRVLSDLVGPKLDHESGNLDRMTRDAGPNPSRADRDALAAQEDFVDELQALRAELARVAPLWKPELDDGVILNFAPLWRLVPHERKWQSECRGAWDRLSTGEYDWAHLAMHLWPERVVLKCAEDRSLAIAHGLEEVFWRQDGAETWHKADVPESKVRALIAERTSSSVKAALKELLSAPTPSGKSAGRRGALAKAAFPRRGAPGSSAPTRATPDVDEATLEAVRAAIAATAEGAAKAEIQAITGVTDADWTGAIATLLDRGDVTRSGQKRGTRYHAKQSRGSS